MDPFVPSSTVYPFVPDFVIGVVQGQCVLTQPSVLGAGSTGSNVPTGGTTGQVLTKLSATNGDATWLTPSGAGLGDTSSNTAVSVDGEIVLFSGTTGKLLRRATASGILKATSGVIGSAAAGTDYLAPGAIGVTVQAFDADLTSIAALASAADKVAYATGPATWALTDFTPTARSLVDDTSIAAMQATLLLLPGTNVQAFHTRLTDWGNITYAQGDVFYYNGTTIVKLVAGSAGQFLKTQGAGANPVWSAVPGGGDLLAANNLSDLANAATARSNLGLTIGSNVQAFNARLADFAAITYAQGDIFYYNGTNVVKLVAGTSGQFLKTQGAAANPIWATIVGGGDALTTNPLSQFAATTSAQLAGVISDETGSGALVFATSPTLVTPLLGTPTSGNLANCTGYPVSALASLGTGVATFLSTPSSANLAAAITNETGSGALVFGTSPTLSAATVSGITTYDSAEVQTVNVMGALAIDVTKGVNTKSLGADSTFTFSGTPATANTWFQLVITNTDTVPHLLTMPSCFNMSTATTAAHVLVIQASGKLHLTFRYDGSAYNLYGDGGFLNKYDATVAPVVGDDVADGYGPGSLWYNATANNLYINEANTAGAAVWTLIAGGGGGGNVAADTIWDAAGDLAVGTGADTAAKLTMGSALQGLRVNAGATALEWATLSVPISTGVSGLGTNVATMLATFSSANIKSACTDETGSGGGLVFATGPTLSAPTVNDPLIQLAALPNNNNSWEGSTLTGRNAGATISQWDAVYLDSTGVWQQADANGTNTYPARGLAVAAYTNGNAATVLLKGVARNDAWAWTIGGTVYLSTTAGALTQTAPSATGDKVQAIGWAPTADSIYVDVNSEYLTHA